MRHFSRAERRELPLFERGTLDSWQRREVLVALMHPTGCPECAALEGALSVHEQALPAQDAVLVRVALVTEALDALHLAQAQCEECSEPLPWDEGRATGVPLAGATAHAPGSFV